MQSRTPAEVDETTPIIRNIRLENVEASDVTLAAAALLGLPEAPITEVHLSAFSVTYDPDAQSDVPLMALGVPTMRHAGVVAEFAKVSGHITILAEEALPTC